MLFDSTHHLPEYLKEKNPSKIAKNKSKTVSPLREPLDKQPRGPAGWTCSPGFFSSSPGTKRAPQIKPLRRESSSSADELSTSKRKTGRTRRLFFLGLARPCRRLKMERKPPFYKWLWEEGKGAAGIPPPPPPAKRRGGGGAGSVDLSPSPGEGGVALSYPAAAARHCGNPVLRKKYRNSNSWDFLGEAGLMSSPRRSPLKIE